MDRFKSMAVFVAVATAGSLSAASRRLRMPLPTVSRKLSELESHVGAKLLIRSTRKLALTDTGQSFLADCQRILEAVAEAERGASGQYNTPRGELVLTAPVALGRIHVVPVTADFLKVHSQIDVRLILADQPLNLVDDRVDAAVRIGVLPDSGLVAVRVGQVRSVICASPAYLKEHGAPQTPGELTSHDCVTFGALAGAQAWTFRDRQSVPVHSRMVVNTAEAAIDGAIAGLGLVRVLSYQVAAAVTAGELEIVLDPFEPSSMPVSLIYARHARLAAKLKAFLDFAAPRLRASLSSAAI